MNCVPRSLRKHRLLTTTMNCAICLERVPSSSIFKTTKRCDHFFCRHCIARHVVASNERGVANVRCPGLNCDAVLDPVRCKRLVSSEQYLRWCDLLCRSAVLGFASCYCPNSNCQELIISERGGNGKVGRFKCPSCKHRGCFRCARPWVEGHRCDNVDRDVNSNLLKRLAKRKQWKRCPNCNIYVERRGGCKMISCKCQTRFCYGCGRKSDLPCACIKDSLALREPQESMKTTLLVVILGILPPLAMILVASLVTK